MLSLHRALRTWQQAVDLWTALHSDQASELDQIEPAVVRKAMETFDIVADTPDPASR